MLRSLCKPQAAGPQRPALFAACSKKGLTGNYNVNVIVGRGVVGGLVEEGGGVLGKGETESGQATAQVGLNIGHEIKAWVILKKIK